MAARLARPTLRSTEGEDAGVNAVETTPTTHGDRGRDAQLGVGNTQVFPARPPALNSPKSFGMILGQPRTSSIGEHCFGRRLRVGNRLVARGRLGRGRETRIEEVSHVRVIRHALSLLRIV